jgi:hypothetical protein
MDTTVLPVCGSHRRGCECAFETRERLIRRRLVRPGPDVTYLPWIDKSTLRLEGS